MEDKKKDGISAGGKFLFVVSYILCFIIEHFCGALKIDDLIYLIIMNFILAIIITYILAIIYAITERLNNK